MDREMGRITFKFRTPLQISLLFNKKMLLTLSKTGVHKERDAHREARDRQQLQRDYYSCDLGL